MGCHWRPTGNQLHRSRHAGAMPAAACSNISVGCTHRMWTAAGQAVAWRGGGTNCPQCIVSWCAGWPLAGLQFCSRRPLKPLRHLLACCRGLQRGGAGGRAGSCMDGRRRPCGCVHTLASPEAAPVQVAACFPRWAQSGSRSWSTNVQTSCCRLHRQPVHAAIASARCAAAGAPTGAGCRRPPSAGWAMP